jgi:hypothetical protein
LLPNYLRLNIAIFIFYLLLFCWLVTRTVFFIQTGLQKKVLVALFIIKIAAGIVYAWFYALPQYIAGSDTWRFFEASKAETDWLLKDPMGFIKDLFQYSYGRSGNLFSGQNSYWNDLKSNLVIKLIAICNVFTFKNYYANLVIFNFLFFFGPAAFYRMMKNVFAEKKLLMVATIFMLPSFIFWCSGLHKDGLIFATLALTTYYFYVLLNSQKAAAKPLILFMLSFVCLFALRNILCLLLLPALLTWFLCHKYPARKWFSIAGVYAVCIALFFTTAYISPSLNFPQYAVQKQNEFKQLQGSSQIHVPALQPNFISFVKFFPAAVDIALLRPHISEMRNVSYLPAILELFLLWSLTGLFLFSKKNLPANPQHVAILIFCFCFAFTYLLLSGYTVTFSGAIVRYKAIVLPFIFCPLICLTNLNKTMIIKAS